MEAAIGGLIAGGLFGAWISRERVCFNSAVRKSGFGGDWSIMRIFAIAVAVQLLLLPLLVIFNADLFSDPDALPAIGLFPVAQVVGGLVFGAGMALAGGCIAGILWKSGAGSVATAIAIGGFIVGELIIRGPLESVLADLDTAVDPPADQTLYAAVGVDYLPLALLLGAGLLFFVLRRGMGQLRAGAVLAAIGVLTWLLAGWAGYGYGLGFVGAAENAETAIFDGGTLSFAVFLAIGTVAGAAVAIRGPLRLPDAPRATRAAAGGLAMGIGGSIAHGCNIGNGLTGIPLLSLGSILATAMMALGVALVWRYALSERPGLRGHERPEVDW
ncbi:MAG TPA: YeeE/YedE family protein [Solirubrobacterales bacterium]|nr:YeeE/YedE family protein [Solirubrobacterales bacterium]